MKTSTKNLTAPATTEAIDFSKAKWVNGTEPATTVASVEVYDKAVAKASKVKAPKKQAHLFAPDGTTRVSAEFHNAAMAMSGDATKQGEAQLALTNVNKSMSDRMRIVWSFNGFTPETTPSQAFKALVAMGYLPADSVAGLSEAERAANLVTYGKPRHPIYSGLSNTHWKQIAAVQASKARAVAAKATAPAVAKADAKNVTEPAVATDVHVKATCSKFMEMKPTATQRGALLTAIAATLGFKLAGFKSI